MHVYVFRYMRMHTTDIDIDMYRWIRGTLVVYYRRIICRVWI